MPITGKVILVIVSGEAKPETFLLQGEGAAGINFSSLQKVRSHLKANM